MVSVCWNIRWNSPLETGHKNLQHVITIALSPSGVRHLCAAFKAPDDETHVLDS